MDFKAALGPGGTISLPEWRDAAAAAQAGGAPQLPYVEFFDVSTDPYEMHNAAPSLPAATLAQLHAQLAALMTCSGSAACNQF